MTIKELRAKRAGIWAQAQEFNSRHKAGDTMSAEDHESWKRALDEIDSLGAEIETLERTANLERSFRDIDERTDVETRGGGTGSVDEYRDAFNQFLRFGLNGVSAEQRQLLEANFVSERAQGATTGAGGGYTVPQAFWAKVTETMRYYGGVLAAGAEVITTESGAPLPWSTNDDTGNEGALLAENTQVGEQDLTFGQKQLDAHQYTSRLIRVSLRLIQDSGIDIEALVARKIGERIGRVSNRHQTVGTGASQPQGVVSGSTVGRTTAAAGAITYNELIDLEHSVDAAYRDMPAEQVAFMFHDLVYAELRKLRDDSGGAGIGRPIWEPSVQVGAPDTLLGRRVVVNNNMASSLVTGARTVAFGNFFAGYVVRQVGAGEVMRLAERYADFLQVGFIGFARMDAIIQDNSAVKVLVQG